MSSPSGVESVTSISSTPSSSQERRRKDERRKVREEASLTKKGFKIRKETINAWMWSQPAARENAVRSVARFTPTARVLEVSGLLWVLRMDEIWAGVPDQYHIRRKEVVKNWSRFSKGAHADPAWLGGHPPVVFKQLVEDLEAWLMHQAEFILDPVVVKKVAIIPVMKGCTHHRLLGGIGAHTVAAWFHKDFHREAVKPFILAAKVRQDCGVQGQFRLRREVESLRPRSFIGGEDPILNLSDRALKSAKAFIAAKVKDYGVEDLFEQQPRNAIASAAMMKREGLDTSMILRRRAEICRFSSPSSSRAQLISALRAWRSFAVDHLGYEDQGWFPPRSAGHLFDFLAFFRNVGTAGNYVGCFKWFAFIHRLDHDWFDESIRLQLKGLRKFTMQGMSTRLKAEMALLNQKVVKSVVEMADAFDDLEFVVIHLTAWSFLSRVQSEVLPLEAGSVHELSGVLRVGRHS